MKTSRKEFLKISSLFTSMLPYYWSEPARISTNSNNNNIIILIFDSWSAKNIPLYGYPRNTTPNLNKLANRATVFHNHFAGGHETYTSTSVLMTGADNWTTWKWGIDYDIHPPFDQKNLFGLFDDYYRIVYTHNFNAERVMNYFPGMINHYQPLQSLFIDNDNWISDYFAKDYETAFLSWVRVTDTVDDPYTNSLLMSRMIEKLKERQINQYYKDFPLGPPMVTGPSYFILEDAIDWIKDQVVSIPSPYLAYFHLLPPHDKYRPRRREFDKFRDDGHEFDLKPIHPMANVKNGENLIQERKLYDEYILYVDDEIGRLFTHLENNGVLENTWIILTTDHGESFERGILGHKRDTFHQPIAHIPLIIFGAGQSKRQDIYNYTHTKDILPTLLSITGHSIPAEIEGDVIPPFNAQPIHDRSLYASTWAPSTSIDWRLRTALMMVKEPYKLIRFEGYKTFDSKPPVYELYDLEQDPEELANIYSPNHPVASRMVEELEEKLLQVDKSWGG